MISGVEEDKAAGAVHTVLMAFVCYVKIISSSTISLARIAIIHPAKGRCVYSAPRYIDVTTLMPQNIRLDSQCSCRLHYSFLRHFRCPREL